MRRNLLLGTGSLIVFLVGLATTSTALAQTQKEAGVTPAQAEAIKALRSAHRLLAEADHDYDGHRAKAAKEVHKALKELGFQPKKAQAAAGANAAVAAPKTHAHEPAVHESQANSDAQLKQAQEILQGVAKQLGTSHPKAAASITAAIGEINTALGVR
jgi:hypothetical protein